MATILFILAQATLLAAALCHHRLSRLRRRGLLLAAPVLALLAIASLADLYLFQKWLSRLAMPVGLLWMMLLGLSIWLLRQPGPRRSAWLALACWLGLSVAGNDVLGARLVALQEAQYPPPSASLEPPLDVLVVLGGGTNQAPGGRAQLGPSGDRVALAARLYHRGYTRQLLATGSSIPGLSSTGSRNLAEEARAIWAELGIAPENVHTLSGVYNTKEEIAGLAKLAPEKKWRRIGLLTSAWHLPRAMRLAARQKLEVLAVPADYRGGQTILSMPHMVPSIGGLVLSQILVREWLATLVGR